MLKPAAVKKMLVQRFPYTKTCSLVHFNWKLVFLKIFKCKNTRILKLKKKQYS